MSVGAGQLSDRARAANLWGLPGAGGGAFRPPSVDLTPPPASNDAALVRPTVTALGAEVLGALPTLRGPTVIDGLGALPPSAEALVTAETPGGTVVLADRADDGAIRLAFDPERAIAFLLAERHHPQRRPAHTYFPGHYHNVPRPVRFVLAKLLSGGVRSQSELPEFPTFPIDASVEWIRALARAVSASRTGAPERAAWPGAKRYALAVTHDVDSAAGFRAVERFVKIEDELGWKGCWYVVAHHYAVDEALLRDVAVGGHEVGVHGFDHRSRTPYLRPERLDARLAGLRAWGQSFGAVGYRAPSLVTTDALFEGVGRHFAYDSSVPTSEPWSLVARARGCLTVLPHWRGACLELPLTLPMDDKLLRMNMGPREMVASWREAIGEIKALGGMAMLSVHSEPHLMGRSDLMDAWRDLLAELAEDDDAWRATPREIARYWRTGRVEGKRTAV